MSSLSPINKNEYNKLQEQQRDGNDSLEYFIKFPTPNFKHYAEVAESDYVFVYNETNVPIVLLLGWAGCQDKYLMKYSKIYEDRGLITVRYTAPVEHLFWKRSAMKPIGEKILQLIFDMNFDSHPLIFHVFSNGGAYLYQHISLAVQKSKKPVQIQGIIFDSAPGERRILGLHRAVSAIYRNKYCNCLTSWAITLGFLVVWFLEESYVTLKRLFCVGDPVQANPYFNLKNEDNNCPQLFLYSKNDLLIPYTDIESFAQHRKKRGVQIEMVCFEDSEHVKLFSRHPQRYVQCVCKFINDCLTSYQRNIIHKND